ncbi:hypothetical protein ACFSKM_01720 [Ancylobacter dichloromethanicus]
MARFSEFSQVHHLVTANVEISDDYAAASTNFDATRMIYGNLFEAFGDNMEVLIALNNVIEGRPFDQLRTIGLAAYRQTDKAGRCRAIADNADMAAVCVEFDNQVRNASHHGGMIFDRVTGTVEYRFGKGRPRGHPHDGIRDLSRALIATLHPAHASLSPGDPFGERVRGASSTLSVGNASSRLVEPRGGHGSLPSKRHRSDHHAWEGETCDRLFQSSSS